MSAFRRLRRPIVTVGQGFKKCGAGPPAKEKSAVDFLPGSHVLDRTADAAREAATSEVVGVSSSNQRLAVRCCVARARRCPNRADTPTCQQLARSSTSRSGRRSVPFATLRSQSALNGGGVSDPRVYRRCRSEALPEGRSRPQYQSRDIARIVNEIYAPFARALSRAYTLQIALGSRRTFDTHSAMVVALLRPSHRERRAVLESRQGSSLRCDPRGRACGL